MDRLPQPGPTLIGRLFGRLLSALTATAASTIALLFLSVPVAALSPPLGTLNLIAVAASPVPTIALPTLSTATPLPLETPILATPTLPVASSSPPPASVSPALSTVTPSPTAAITPAPTSSPSRAPVTAGGAGGSPAGGGVRVPFTTVVLRSPLDLALAGSLAVLPLLLGLWLLLVGRTWASARRAREANLRLALAADLGLTPRQLESLGTHALFKLREQTAFDELTGVLRRAAGVAATERELARARRQMRPLTVAFVDVDGLKQTNDRGGHAAGDELLRNLAYSLKAGLRGQDLIFRYGGDEFVCVLPDTDEEAARAKLAEIRSSAADRHGLRFCVGVAQMQKADDVVTLLARADRELYRQKAKRPGERRIVA